MRIVDSERVLFVHIPKTGGRTLENVLESSGFEVRRFKGSRHHTLGTILAEEPELGDYWTFGFVRNPWDRMLSWWSMINRARRRADAGDPVMVRKFENYPVWKGVRDYPDFETFVLRGPREVEELALAQVDYLRAGDRRADFIGRTESIEQGVDVVRKRLGLDVPLDVPHRNRTKHGHYEEYYTAAMRDQVAAVYRADVEEFGYEF
jgi:hypothetical protein